MAADRSSRHPESEDEDFAISEDLVRSPAHRAAETRTIDFDALHLQPALVLHQDLAEGNGGQAWPVISSYQHVEKKLIAQLGRHGFNEVPSTQKAG